MQGSPTTSFFKFTLAFLTFISLSFGLTFAVNSYSIKQERAQQAAAIQAMMLDDIAHQ